VRRLGQNKKAANQATVIILAIAILASAVAAFHFSTTVGAANSKGTQPGLQEATTQKAAIQKAATQKQLSSKSLSLPLFFEPNQGQTDRRVKFLARGKGYGLFLTSDEAVLELQPSASLCGGGALPRDGAKPQTCQPAPRSEPPLNAVIRMRLAGANSSSRVSGTSPLPGKSNYFIGNDSAKWRNNIPQFGGVEYQSVYRGVDLLYYGNQNQLEYDFRVAPGADPNQIALNFDGAKARIVPSDSRPSANSNFNSADPGSYDPGSADAGSNDSGDLILATASGDIRFHAPRIYQPAVPATASSPGSAEKSITGSFRQLAGNKIGFAIGDYDRSRELVIDPILTYSTYLGGANGNENYVQVAVDSNLLIYVAGSTTSPNFPLSPQPSSNPPYQLTYPGGAQNIFIAVINTSLQPPAYVGTPSPQIVYSTYLGGTGTDILTGIAVDSAFGIYVTGTTTSTDFPTTASNAFQPTATFSGNQTHGFLSVIAKTAIPTPVYQLSYSTYLAGNGSDIVAGLAIDPNCGGQSCNAYLTGSTTSTNDISNYFPANPNGYQRTSNAPANTSNYPQFFASKINPNASGQASMLYSTYFGGGNPATGVIAGCSPTSITPPCGGIAVDTSGNMYITGTTNMLSVPGTNNSAQFPILNAQQPCLNQSSTNTSCSSSSTDTDAFVAKIYPVYSGAASLIYSTYLGGNASDTGNAIAVDSSDNAYVTGQTYSASGWSYSGTEFQPVGYIGNGDAYIAEIGSLTGSQSGAVYPLSYFTYLGGNNTVGNAIQVNSLAMAFVAGTTSGNLAPANPIQSNPPISTYNGGTANGQDAFVAAISTTSGGQDVTPPGPLGDFLSYLGGSGSDSGTGIALDLYGTIYVAGTTGSSDFPLTTIPIPLQPTLASNSSTDAFVTKIGALSALTITQPAASPNPNPAPIGGTPVAFTYNITNSGPDTASQVTFSSTVSTNVGLAALASPPAGKMDAGTGTCTTSEGTNDIVSCVIPTINPGSLATVEVDVTTNDTTTPVVNTVSVSSFATANGTSGQIGGPSQTATLSDFLMTASNPVPTINAGQSATITVNFCPQNPLLGYQGTITPSESISPTMDTSTSPTFTPTPVNLTGSACASTALTIATVARPTTTGSLSRPGSFYAAFLPIGGLSLIGLGLGARGKRRRWLLAASLCLLAAVIMLLPSCGSSSTTAATPGGTQAGTYNITVTGSASAGASHTAVVQLRVN
jgi:hypothetical protein